MHGTTRHRGAAPLATALAIAALALGCAPQAQQAIATTGAEPAAASPSMADTGYVVAATDSAAGSYLMVVGGCHDCHTASWNQTNGATPQAERLTGSPIGYRGPWGTSYAANLRLVAARVTEDRWVEILTTRDGGDGRPPMPWMNTEQMSRRDLRNMYRYVRALGPAGERTPRPVHPDSTPTTPYILMVPQQPGAGER